MKKCIVILFIVFLTFSLIACSEEMPANENVSGVKDEENSSVEISQEILDILGMSEEEFAAMDPEKQQTILDEIGAVIEQQENDRQTQQNVRNYTPEDVAAGGNYVVVLGDETNSITLYYEDGVLVKIVEEFQKNSEEEASSATYEGESLAEYGFNFIDWDGVSLQDILDGMKDYGGFSKYQIRKVE